MSRFAWNNAPLRLGRSGMVAIEFAFCAVALLGVLLGSIDLGRYYFTAQSVRELVGEVARAAAVDSSLTGCTAPLRYAARTPMLSDPSKLTLCVDRPAAATSPSTVTVHARYQFSFVLWMLRNRVNSIAETTLLTLP